MKLFCKHLFGLICRFPLQPLFILCTVICSVAVAVTSVQLSVAFTRHAGEVAGEQEQLGDLLISMRADSDVRMLFCEDAEELVGTDGSVIGEFRLSGFLESGETETFLSVSAVCLEAADAFYQFHYSEYGVFTEETRATSAILSEAAAREQGLSLGDSFTLRVLGEEFPFTVRAIAGGEGLLTKSEVLIDIACIRQTLASRVPAIAALGDAFVPYTTLMVRLSDPAQGEAVKERLEGDERFADKTVEMTAKPAQYRFLVLTQSLVLWLPSLLILLLAALILLQSLQHLQEQRRVDTALFCACGASARHLGLFLVLESGFYAALGACFGVLLSIPMLRHLSGIYNWPDFPLLPQPFAVCFGIFWAILLIEGCTLLHLWRRRTLPLAEQLREVEGADLSQPRRREWILPLCVSGIAWICAVCAPIDLRFVPAIALLVAMIWLLFVTLPLFFYGLARILRGGVDRRRYVSGTWMLTVKRLLGCTVLRHVGRLTTVLLSLLLTVTVCVQVLEAQLNGLFHSVVADTVAVYADERTAEQVAAHPDVESVLRFTYLPLIEVGDGYTAFAFSAADAPEGFLELQGMPEEMPKGERVALSVGLAELLGVDVGDRVRVSVNGMEAWLTVSEVMASNIHFVVCDVTAFGIEHPFLAIRLRSGADPRASESIVALLEQNGASRIEKEEIFNSMPRTITSHIRLLRLSLVVSAALTVIGCAHVLIRFYSSQRRERALLVQNGMTRAGIARLYLAELGLLLAVSLFLAVLCGALLCKLVDLGIRSFGMRLFL